MKLSNELVSQFVKITRDKTNVKNETTVYGTVVLYDDNTYVKIDGSDLLTPVDSIVSVIDGERVSILISDHKAVITGNYTDPSASAKEVKESSFKDTNIPNTLQVLTSSVELLVNANSGNDEWTIDEILESYDEAEENNDDSLKKKYKTLQGAIDAIPKFFNNKSIYITLETDVIDDTYIRGISGGALKLYMNGKNLYGWFKGYVCSSTIYLYGGTRDNPKGNLGVIHPSIGLSFGSITVSAGFESCQYVSIHNMKIYAPDTLPSDIDNTNKVALGTRMGTGTVYCEDVQVVNSVIGFRASSGAQMHMDSSSGIASKYGFQAVAGGKISFENNVQAGGIVSATNKNTGGQIWYDEGGPTFASGDSTNDSSAAPATSTIKTLSIKSSYGDAYRLNVYTGWKKDNTVIQGDYGYGDCVGCWFFGTEFAEVKGKTITKVTITIERQRGGNTSAVGLVVKTHNHASRPSGSPKFGITCGTLSLAVNTKGTLTITDETILANIKSGKVKGFGLQSSYNSSKYAVCSGTATVKITYIDQ